MNVATRPAAVRAMIGLAAVVTNCYQMFPRLRNGASTVPATSAVESSKCLPSAGP
jgi:hypothetical protein